MYKALCYILLYYVCVYICVYICVHVYHINPRIICISCSPHGKMWTGKHVYRASQEQNLEVVGVEAFYFVMKIATESSSLEKGWSLPTFILSHVEVHILEQILEESQRLSNPRVGRTVMASVSLKRVTHLP